MLNQSLPFRSPLAQSNWQPTSGCWGITFVIFLVGSIGFSGCSGRPDGPPRAAAKGKVLLNGQPLEGGVVQFIPIGNTKGPSATATVSQGEFALPKRFGPVIGSNRIEVEVRDSALPDPDDEQAVMAYAAKMQGRPTVIVTPQMTNPPPGQGQEITANGPNEFVLEMTTPVQSGINPTIEY